MDLIHVQQSILELRLRSLFIDLCLSKYNLRVKEELPNKLYTSNLIFGELVLRRIHLYINSLIFDS